MKRLLFWIYLMLKKQLKNPFIVAFLIAIPVLCLIVTKTGNLKKTDTIKVGLVLTDSDPTAVNTVEKLVKGDYSVKFYISPSKDDLINDIMEKRAECGYVFSKDITRKIEENDYNESLECVINESDYISSMSNEIVFSVMFKEFAGDVLDDFIKSESAFSANRELAAKMAKERYDKYLEGDETFHLTFTVLDNKNNTKSQLEQTTGKFPLRPVLYILVFAGGLFGVAWFKEDEAKGMYATLSKGYRILGKPVYAFIGAFLFWLSSSLSLIIVGTKIGPREVLLGILYVILVTVYAWILGSIFNKMENYIGATFLIIVTCFIFCPVFINVSLYLPAAKYISYLLLPNYFI